MGEDESATVKTLETYKQVMFSLIRQHRGRVIDSPADNLLAEFASVVDAVQCGVAVQKELQALRGRAKNRAPRMPAVCAGHGTGLVGWKSPRQVFAEAKARRRERASSRGGV